MLQLRTLQRIHNGIDSLNTDAHQQILEELVRREPLFHRPDFGRTRADFEEMTDEDFFEVGASGRRYSRASVIDGVTKRYENPDYHGMESLPESSWETKDFQCLQIAPNNYLLTYTLVQGPRVTHRATIWRRKGACWKVLYHQGTIIEDP
jgi:hypothetical protein